MVIDSIACPFRHDFDDMGLRSRILSGTAQTLIRVATQSNLAVECGGRVPYLCSRTSFVHYMAGRVGINT